MPPFPRAKPLEYIPCDYAEVPVGTQWKGQSGYGNSKTHTTLFSLYGCTYKLVRELATGEVCYFKLKDTGPEKSPAAKIDAEPGDDGKKAQVRYKVGSHCWLVEPGALWYLCTVVAREPAPASRITIKPVTGWDADRKAQWPYSEELQFVAKASNVTFQRLRPLQARNR